MVDNLIVFLISSLIVGVFVLFFWPSSDNKYIKIVSLSYLFFLFFISLFLFLNFDNSTSNFQFLVELSWFNHWNINCSFGIDGISLFLVLLTTLLIPLCLLGSWHSISLRIKEYLICFF